jgi:predicted ArsR family transcriptional regulator
MSVPVDFQQLVKEIHKRELKLKPAKALHKHNVKISICRLLQEESPSSIKEIAQKIGITERHAWRHVKELREWGILPENFHRKK